jgi:aminoglycoside phosphotransferase (APT) family kinase protein
MTSYTPDLERLAAFFAAEVPGYAGGPLAADLVEGGRSNLTYRITDGTSAWVLRRPPLGNLTPTAHDMRREYRMIAGLYAAGMPVAEPVAYCPDTSVIGADFSVVGYVDGRVVRTDAAAAALTADEASAATTGLVRTLVALHQVDHTAEPLSSMGRPDGYVARQVRRWRDQWERVRTRDCADADRLQDRLAGAVPDDSASSVVHGDYRLDNTILSHDDAGTVLAVVDWEMATLGDPLADLGLMCLYWDPACRPVLGDQHPPSANPGFGTPDDLAHRYSELSGRDVGRLSFYRALAYYKLAVIAEGIHARYLAGNTVGPGFASVGTAVPALLATGLQELASSD